MTSIFCFTATVFYGYTSETSSAGNGCPDANLVLITNGRYTTEDGFERGEDVG